MNLNCVIVKQGLNPATNREWWVVKTDSFMILKGIKIEKGAVVGKFSDKELAVCFAKSCGLTIVRSDRDT